ncbi:MAG: WG repeat-containing protein [Prolixibacteraceae bacterium]|nr:WG repeat-containing protein [Prolixibacteraceae bacterium]
MKKYLSFLLIFILAASCNSKKEFNLVPFSDGEKWGFKDNNKNIFLNAKYDDAYAFSEGLAAVKINDKWGYINHDGKEIIPPVKYEKAGSFSEELCMVCQNGKWGFIDKKGEEVIPPVKFERVGNFSEGLAMACEDGKYGFINKKGETVIPLKYDFARDFSNERAKVMQNQRFGFVDDKGNEVVPIKYDMAGEFFNELVLTRQNENWALVDMDGEEVVELDFNFVWDIDNGGFYKVFNNGKYGFVNQDGKEIVLLKYEYAEDFENNIALVKRNGKFGVIDRSGLEIIDPVFSNLKRLGDGIIMYQKPGKGTGFIDYYGNPVVDKDVTQTIRSHSSFTEPSPESFTDQRDGQEYSLVTIGDETWMGSNLLYNVPGSKCYDNKCGEYGRYYTFEMAQKACPEGWKLPSKADFDKLINELGGPENAYPKLVEGESNLKINLNGYFFNDASIEGLTQLANMHL